MKRRIHVDPEDFSSYDVRAGKDGKFGIYTRDFNCRLAKFNSNTYALQKALGKLFDRAAAPIPKPKRKPYVQRRPGDEDVFSEFQRSSRGKR